MIARLWALAEAESGRIAASLALGVGVILAGVGLMATSGYLIGRAALRPDTILALMVVVTSVRFFGVARPALRYVERLVSHDLTFRLLSRLRVWLYERLEPLAPARLLRTRAGDLLSLWVGDIDTLQHAWLRVAAPALVAAITTLVVTVALSFVDLALAAVVLALLALSGVGVPLLVRRLATKIGRQQVDARAAYAAQAVETLQGMADLLLMNREEARWAELDAQAHTLARLEARQARITGLQGTLNLLLVLLAVVATLALATPLIRSGAIGGPVLAVLALGVMTAFEAVLPLGTAWQLAPQARRAAERLVAVGEETPAVRDPADPRTLTDVTVRFELVGFGYDDRPVLHDVDLTLEPGRRLAVVGPSGAGKSTLLHLLARFWDPVRGRIVLGGHDLRCYAQQDLRASMAVFTQQTFLFATSVRDNLRVADPHASDDELWTALTHAQLAETVRALPNGLDTDVGEHGLRLSAGERQRLGLARVVLRDAPLVLLDEVTANLDTENERRLLSALERATAGRSVLMVTHRLVGMEAFDEIVVMTGGRIVERGSHAELARQGGLYRRLLAAQRDQLRA